MRDPSDLIVGCLREMGYEVQVFGRSYIEISQDGWQAVTTYRWVDIFVQESIVKVVQRSSDLRDTAETKETGGQCRFPENNN